MEAVHMEGPSLCGWRSCKTSCNLCKVMLVKLHKCVAEAPSMPCRLMRQSGSLRWLNNNLLSSAFLNYSTRHNKSKKREQTTMQLTRWPTSTTAVAATAQAYHHVVSTCIWLSAMLTLHHDCCAALHLALTHLNCCIATSSECDGQVCRRKKEEQKRKKDQAKILGKRGARTKLSFKLG